jgi:hypothetical protein
MPAYAVIVTALCAVVLGITLAKLFIDRTADRALISNLQRRLDAQKVVLQRMQERRDHYVNRTVMLYEALELVSHVIHAAERCDGCAKVLANAYPEKERRQIEEAMDSIHKA